MKKELFKELEIPEGVKVSLEENILIVEGKEGINKKKFNFGRLNFEIKDNKIVIGSKKSTKMEKKLMNTIVAHIKNMLEGVQNKFTYTLKICHSHFPFTVKQEGKKITVKNFLGEKLVREMALIDGVEIEIGKDIITVKSPNKELAGQAAANFETITKIRGRDKRIFQDGIYIIDKNGKKI